MLKVVKEGCEIMKRDVEGKIYHLDKMITALVELLKKKASWNMKNGRTK